MAGDLSETPFDVRALSALTPDIMDLGPRARPGVMAFLLTRRSAPAKLLDAPGPSDAELDLMLRAACRVPDHGKLSPWRFIIVEQPARAALADAAASAAADAGEPDEQVAKIRVGMLQAPTLIIVVYAPKPNAKIPSDEQYLAAGAACGALVNAALASGYGAQWLTGRTAHDATFGRSALGLGDGEKIVGFVHIGTARAAPPERPRPDVAKLTTTLSALGGADG